MTRAALLACLLMPLVAEATSFEEYSTGVQPRAAEQLSEASCDVVVDIRGAVAGVELTQRITNAGVKELASIHRFTLPKGAAITGFAVKVDTAARAASLTAVPVAAAFRSELIESAGVLGADPAVLRKIGDDEYEILAQPFAGELALTTKYAMRATVQSSTLRVGLPGRVAAAKLATCKGVIRATPGPSAAVTAIRVDNAVVGNRASAAFSLGMKDVAIDIELAVSGNAPVVWQQSDGAATLVTVIGPLIKAAAARKVVVLIDTSRSMDLVGRPNVVKVVKALGGALPPGSEIEAILFDRTATRVFNALRPANGENLAAIEAALAKRGAINGSDLVAAFAMAKQVISNERGQPMIVAITDGVTADLAESALTKALASTASAVDVHAIVLDPAQTRSPGAPVLRGPVNAYGGAYVEVHTDELDDALTAIDDWLRPSWLELAMGDHEIPTELRSGAGFTKVLAGKPVLTLKGHSTTAFVSPSRPGPAAPIGVFAQPLVTDDRALAVLATTGKIAKNRIAMINGGGRYDRSIAVSDPPHSAPLVNAATPIPASAIARITLERMFRDQLQPKAYVCYQRGIQRNNKLAGTVRYKLRMGRGEVSDVELTQKSGDAEFDKCLVDAAYLMTPPLPDFTINSDDQTVANYPLSFAQRQDQPVIVPGDADSESPIDIDAVEGGVPGAPRKPVKPDTKTPLGGMKPPKSP